LKYLYDFNDYKYSDLFEVRMILSDLVVVNRSNFNQVLKNKKILEESEKIFFRLKGNQSLREGWMSEKW
jgi:hypothetical protein